MAQLSIRASSQCVEMVPDNLQRNVVWPVYPELAVRLGLDGGTIFKGPVLNDKFEYFSLDVLVDNFFASYKLIDSTILREENIQKLLEVI